MCRSLWGTTRINGRHNLTVSKQQLSTPMSESASWLGVTKIETPLSFLYVYLQSKTLDKYRLKNSLCFSSWHFKIPSNTANNMSEDQNGRVSFPFHSLLSCKKYPTSVFQTKLEINTYKTFHTCYNTTKANCYTNLVLFERASSSWNNVKCQLDETR